MILNNKKNFYKGENAIFDFINPENYYTPLIELPSLINPFRNKKINIFVKLSWFNPLFNIKVLPAYWMLKKAREDGIFNKKYKLIEASSGNMAYALKILSKYFGVKDFKALVSDKVTPGKRKILDIFGIKYKIQHEDICPDPKDPKSSINIAKSFRKRKNWYNLGQYDNPNNYLGHYYLTGKQIWDQLSGDIDIVSVGLGTTGTLIGVSKYLKEKNESIKIIGVIREKNNLIPGVRTINLLKEINFDWEKYLDYKIFVGGHDSYLWSLKLIREGLFCGPSSGFALFGLIKFIRENKDLIKKMLTFKNYLNCVFIAPDTFLPYIFEYFDVLEIKEENSKNFGIDSEKLFKILKKDKKDIFLIDIRDKFKFKDAHIPKSINVEYYNLLKNFKKKLKNINKKIILICDYEIKSKMIANFLRNQLNKNNIFYLKGGISQWSIKNYPREGNICFDK